MRIPMVSASLLMAANKLARRLEGCSRLFDNESLDLARDEIAMDPINGPSVKRSELKMPQWVRVATRYGLIQVAGAREGRYCWTAPKGMVAPFHEELEKCGLLPVRSYKAFVSMLVDEGGKPLNYYSAKTVRKNEAHRGLDPQIVDAIKALAKR